MRKFLKKTNYAARYNKFGVHPKALGWHSKKAAEQRYKQIVRDINFKGKSLKNTLRNLKIMNNHTIFLKLFQNKCML